MNFDPLQTALGKLKTCYESLKKLPHRKRKPEGGEKKLQQVQNLWKEFSSQFALLDQNQLTELEQADLKRIVQLATRYKTDSEDLVSNSIEDLSSASEEEEDQLNVKPKPFALTSTDNASERTMGEFDLNTAQKLPVLTCDNNNTRTENIKDFLNSVEFYRDTLEVTAKPTLITFLVKCKIQGSLTTKCGSRETIETIQSKLDRTRQANRPMREFVSEIEYLVTKMTELEITTQGETSRATLTSANERRGLAFLKKGVQDRYKIVVDIARHTKMQDAIEHLLELNPSATPTPETVRYANSRFLQRPTQNRGQGNVSRNFRHDRRPNYSNYPNNHSQSRTNNFPQSQPRYNYPRGNNFNNNPNNNVPNYTQ